MPKDLETVPMRFLAARVVSILTVAVLVGCTETSTPPQPTANEVPAVEEPSTWEIVEEENLNEAQVAQRDRALAARDALMGKLKKRLMEVVSTDGLPAAIAVCKGDAPRLAKEVSKERALSIGRTSHRLRNTANQPPAWAKALVEDKIADPTYLTSRDSLAALLPIPTGPMCLNCHGPEDGIAADVKKALNEQYPDDQATGFEEDDLRGWFWVEVRTH